MDCCISRFERCVYCLTDKEKTKDNFNIEHVIPQFMGTYENSYTLSSMQVCRECNTYFNKDFENKLATDSFEAILRAIMGNRKMGDGTKIGNKRFRVNPNEGIFKGLEFRYEIDNTRTPKLKANYKGIGLLIDEETNEYDYYQLEDLPFADEEILKKLRGKNKPIVTHNLDNKEVLSALAEKGYSCTDYYEMIIDENNIHEVFAGQQINSTANIKIEPISKRLFAKTVFIT